MKKRITNTKNEPHIDWLFGMNPRAIENQEAAGQRELVESQQLPRKCNHPSGINSVVQYHKMGIRVFTGSKGDDLFMDVKLPDGWKKEATGHSMWNNLIDDQGRIRATLFYKAAFYDRDAFINFETRYQWTADYCEKGFTSYIVKDTATGKILFRTEQQSDDCRGMDYFKKQDELQQQCKDFLSWNFPDHQDINAYW